MFLDEMAGNISFNKAADRQLDSNSLLTEPVRPYAAPEMRDGKAYITSFVWVDAQEVIAQLKKEGVIVEEVFDKGLLTPQLPDKDEERACQLCGTGCGYLDTMDYGYEGGV